MEKNQSGCDGEPLIGSARNSSLRTRHGVRSLPSGWVDLEDTSELRLRKILHLQLTANPISHSLVGGAHSVTLRLFLFLFPRANTGSQLAAILAGRSSPQRQGLVKERMSIDPELLDQAYLNPI